MSAKNTYHFNHNPGMSARSLEQLFNTAMEQHKRGNFAQAEPLYRQVLQAQPKHSFALNLLGILLAQSRNDHVQAEKLIEQAIAIDPFNITNLFFNYTMRGSSRPAKSRVRLAVNNLTDSHAITGVSPASAKSNAPNGGDILTLMPGRSVSVAFTVGVSPK